jgi:hypothetical protein
MVLGAMQLRGDMCPMCYTSVSGHSPVATARCQGRKEARTEGRKEAGMKEGKKECAKRETRLPFQL